MDTDMSEPKVDQQQEQAVVDEVPIEEQPEQPEQQQQQQQEEVSLDDAHLQHSEHQPMEEEQPLDEPIQQPLEGAEEEEHHQPSLEDEQVLDPHQYEPQYDATYEPQYDTTDAPQESYDDTHPATSYDDQATYDDQVVVDAAAVATAAAAAAAAQAEQDQPYDQQYEQPQADQQYDAQYDSHEQQYEPHDQLDDQTLAAHPARDAQESTADASMARYDDPAYASHPGALQTLAATSSAAAPHTPQQSHMYSQKPLTPKFNRARNWTRDETKILLAELERIVAENPEDRREVMLRAHPTFEQTASVLREHGFVRDGQGCMIRWRNLLRVYKQQRAASDSQDPSVLQNYPYANEIESIYRFPPEGISSSYHIHGDSGSPGPDGSQSGHSRTWTQANGSAYETPARKRQREMHQLSDQIERMDQKLDQANDVISQLSDVIRSLEDRVARSEEALKQSEATLESINTTIGEKDAKRDELEKQLMVTVQALSQVIAAKKAEQQ